MSNWLLSGPTRIPERFPARRPKGTQFVDLTGGYAELRERRLRLIAGAAERYREDPVRMLRAVRFAGKLGFDIEGETSRTIYELAP